MNTNPEPDDYPTAPATWEMPPCDSCGGECVFTDGLCQPCWILYTERS